MIDATVSRDIDVADIILRQFEIEV
jgi:hypothetical protein